MNQSMPSRVVILGAGKMAHAIAHALLQSPEVSALVVADREVAHATRLVRRLRSKRVRAETVDVTRPRALARLLRGAACVIGATTYAHNLRLTEACIAARTHFCDLGGNDGVVAAQHGLNAEARRAGVSVIPDCGLAPGLVNILAYHWAQPFSHLESLAIRVGGLPQAPQPPLRYQLAFSVQGLINEYVEKAQLVVGGKKRAVPSMTGVEALRFAAPYGDLEAFYTSGGVSSLPRTLGKRVANLDYKTIRYPGHAEQIRLLMELGLCNAAAIEVDGQAVAPRRVLETLLDARLPHGEPDVVLIRIALAGQRDGRVVREVHDCVDHFDSATGLSAMQRTTGFSIAIVARLLLEGAIGARGVLYQEQCVPAPAFLAALEGHGIRFTG
jgi:lysine 6-dehydrogenase